MALTNNQRNLVADMFHQLLHEDGRMNIKNADKRREVRTALNDFVTLKMPTNLKTFEGAPGHSTRLIKTFVAMLHFGLPIDVSELGHDSTAYEALLFAAERV